MGLLLCWSYNGALGLLWEIFLMCSRNYRRAGLSVCWGAAVCRKWWSGVRSLCWKLMLCACHFPFASLPRTCSSTQSRQPGGPSFSLVLEVICESLARPAVCLATYIMFILSSCEVFFAAGRRFGALPLHRSLFIWLVVRWRFGSSGLRLFNWFYWTYGFIHPSCGVSTTLRITRKASQLKSRHTRKQQLSV